MEEPIQMPSQRSSNCLLIVLLLLVSAVVVFYAVGQMGGSGYSFEQEEAYQLAQEAQAYRRTHPTPANYGLASITIFSQDGSSHRFVPTTHGLVVPFESESKRNIHSEEFAHDWILSELAILKKARYIDTQTTTGITVIIFSQVRVCSPCRIAMRDWQQEFRQASGFPTLELSIWQLTRGYDPAVLPKGKPVTSEDDVTEVIISFSSRLWPPGEEKLPPFFSRLRLPLATARTFVL